MQWRRGGDHVLTVRIHGESLLPTHNHPSEELLASVEQPWMAQRARLAGCDLLIRSSSQFGQRRSCRFEAPEGRQGIGAVAGVAVPRSGRELRVVVGVRSRRSDGPRGRWWQFGSTARFHDPPGMDCCLPTEGAVRSDRPRPLPSRRSTRTARPLRAGSEDRTRRSPVRRRSRQAPVGARPPRSASPNGDMAPPHAGTSHTRRVSPL